MTWVSFLENLSETRSYYVLRNIKLMRSEDAVLAFWLFCLKKMVANSRRINLSIEFITLITRSKLGVGKRILMYVAYP